MKVTKDIIYVGVNDHQIDLFEGQYKVPNGMSYNSYVILDDKTAVMDSVDQHFFNPWIENIEKALNGKAPDYLVVQHMEPDHSANIKNFLDKYQKAIVVSSQKAFTMMKNFFGTEFEDRRIVVKEGESLNLGHHVLNFVGAPMVHWPEVLFTYDSYEKVLFSADGFGKFGALDKDEPWADEARRYYIGIVGKYGMQVQNVLKKAAGLDIQTICPLHGPVLNENLGYYLNLYNLWSSYTPEEEGILVCYTSVYGHTKAAVELLVKELKEKGAPKVVAYDLARTDKALAVADAFKYSSLVLATTTYNAEIYPFMRDFIEELAERNYQNRTVAFIENGSWAPMAYKIMKAKFDTLKNIKYTENNVHLLSALNEKSTEEVKSLASELCKDYKPVEVKVNKYDPTALFKIGYGLYVITSNDGTRDDAMIGNTVSQVAVKPNLISVCINKANYSHDVIKKTGHLNINCLSTEAPFSVFQDYGFRSGRDCDKFEGVDVKRSDNGLVVLPKYINAYMSLTVDQYVDLGSHGMFICTVSESVVVCNKPTMTYDYYQANVKPKPQTETTKKAWVCKVCGYVYEGDELPEDFVCPLCKHPASDFEPVK